MHPDELIELHKSYLSNIDSSFTRYRGLLDAILVRGKGATQDQLIALSVMADLVEETIVSAQEAAQASS